MYRWIWQKLPFGLPGKLSGSVLLVTMAVGLLWFVVFPWAEPLLPFDDVQVSQEADVPGGPAGPPAGDAPGLEGDQPGEGHDLPYDTDRNNTPPGTRPSPTKSPR